MLKLFDEGLKGAIIKKPKCAITNKLETNGKQKTCSGTQERDTVL